jgi:hypothetical protein
MKRNGWGGWIAASMAAVLVVGCISETSESLLGPAGEFASEGIIKPLVAGARSLSPLLSNGNDNSTSANDNGGANDNTNGGANGNDNSPGDLGACCLPDGTCVLLTQAECEGTLACKGDSDCDVDVDFDDITPFVIAVGDDGTAWAAYYESLYGHPPACGYLNNDMDGDGDVDFDDISPFVNAIGTSCGGAGGTWLGAGSTCDQCMIGNGNDNSTPNGNDNGTVNGNDNAGANGNDNGTVNGNDNGTANGNDNGVANGNDNGGTNGNDNGTANGNDNGGTNGNDNGGTNGNDNGAANGNDNGTANGNDNGGTNGNDNGTANGNDNGGVNGNDNGAANGNDNGTANGNDNGGANGNDNGGVNGNDNGSGGTCPDGSTQLSTVLTPGSDNDAEYRRFADGSGRFRVRVRDFPAFGSFDVTINGVVVGTLSTDDDGRGELRIEPLPGSFPLVFPGDVVSVGGLASGTFVVDCSS